MRHFKEIPIQLFSADLLRAELDQHPELWDEFPVRTTADSPFAGTSDIWVRYRAREELNYPGAYRDPHWPVFWPAWYALPTLRPIVVRLMSAVQAVHLGAIFITRIPPGVHILPHNDKGSWHAEFFRTKLYVPLRTGDGCLNRCGGEMVEMRAGEVWQFDNLAIHSVENDSPDIRETLIVCTRTIEDEMTPA